MLILLLMAPVVFGTLALRSSREDFTSALATVETRAIKGTDSLQGMDAAVVAFLSYLLRGNETAVDTINERFDTARDATVRLRDSSQTPAQVSGWTDAVRQLDAWKAAADDAIEAKGAGRDEEAPGSTAKRSSRSARRSATSSSSWWPPSASGRRRSPTSASDNALQLDLAAARRRRGRGRCWGS